jgi:long-subunit acyl-CoA synthetase (AMP-forming)
VDELSFILSHSCSVALVLQDRATLLKLLPVILSRHQQAPVKFVGVLWQQQHPHASPTSSNGTLLSQEQQQQQQYLDAVQELSRAGVSVLEYDEVLSAGAALRVVGPFQPAQCSRDSLATVVYTSGTTGR